MNIPRKLNSLCQKICMIAIKLSCMAVMLIGAPTQAQPASEFDHAATAFLLTGSHEQVHCESCHIKGIFKGTPRDCAGCHVVNNQRGALAKSFKHIQSSLNCESCHSTSSFGAVLFNHSLAEPGLACASCHDGNRATSRPLNHLPRANAAQCGSCHIASTLNSFVSFAGGKMDHTGMVGGCADCHGPSITGSSFAGINRIVVMPPTSPVGASSHIPSSTVCESCHLASLPAGPIEPNAMRAAPGSGFASPAPTSVQIHAGITGGCSSCHDTNFVWIGMGAYPITPLTVINGALYKGFQTRPTASGGTYAVADAFHPTAGECSECHKMQFDQFQLAARVRPIRAMRGALNTMTQRIRPDGTLTVAPGSTAFSHQGVTTGQCQTCHNGQTAQGKPVKHLKNMLSCDSCHRNTAWTPAQFDHKGMQPGQCQVCHNGSAGTGKPAGHFTTARSCDSCHKQIAWVPVNYSHVSSLYRPQPDKPNCVSCHVNNIEFIPRQMRGGVRPRPVPSRAAP